MLLYDSIMCPWIKTLWEDWMDVTQGLCKHTIMSIAEISNKIYGKEIDLFLWSVWHPDLRMNSLKRGRMMRITSHPLTWIKKIDYLIFLSHD